MRLDELTRSETRKIIGTNWEIPQLLQRWLLDRGFDQIGYGHFSVVYGRPESDKVIKISKSPEIDCALLFAKLSRRQRFKHFPIVYNVKEFGKTPSSEYKWAGGEDGFFVVIMERLYPFDPFEMRWSNDPEYNLGLIVYLYNADVYEQNKAIKFGELPEILDEYTNLSDEQINHLLRSIEEESYVHREDRRSQEIARKWKQKYQNDSLVKALNLLEAEVVRNNCSFLDLKRENLMLRSDGTLVLLDPLPF